MTSGKTSAGRGASPNPFVIVVFSTVLAAGVFLLQGHIGLNLADEGHLWYVTARTAAGDVPLRDVRAYEPARYYWGALWFMLLGPGIVSIRVGATIVQALGLVFALLTLQRIVRSWWLLGLLGLLSLAWMYPVYKAFECTTPLALAWLLVRLLETPTPARYFAAGVGVGLSGFMRVDHGLYGGAALFITILYLAARIRGRSSRGFGVALAGVAVGYAPMLVMFAVVPGYPWGFVEHISYLLRIVAWSGNPNLARPIPWPWPRAGSLPPLLYARVLSFGILFLVVPAAYLLAGLTALIRRRDDVPPGRVLLGAGVVGVMYLHYTFSRADLEHLAPSMPIFIITGAALIAGLRPALQLAVTGLGLPIVLALSAFSVGMASPAYLRLTASHDPYVRAALGRDLVWIPSDTARFLDIVRRTVEEHLKPGERLLVAPHWPGLYAFLERESPLWETYLLYPEQDARQRAMIADLDRHNVRLAILSDILVDGRADLHLRSTHALVYRHLLDHFEELRVPGLGQSIHVLRRKTARVSAAWPAAEPG